MLFAPLWRCDDLLSCALQGRGLANSSCGHCCSGLLWWRAEDLSLLRLRGRCTAPTSVTTHSLFCVRSNKPANLFKCCCPVHTHTFLQRHSLDWDFSIDVWPDLCVSNMTANKSSAHWTDPIWPDRDKMTGAGWQFFQERMTVGDIREIWIGWYFTQKWSTSFFHCFHEPECKVFCLWVIDISFEKGEANCFIFGVGGWKWYCLKIFAQS